MSRAYLFSYVNFTDFSNNYQVKVMNKVLLTLFSCGGNLLMNIGPTSDGRIIPLYQERLKQFGNWLKINGEAIYGSKPWIAQQDILNPQVWFVLLLYSFIIEFL